MSQLDEIPFANLRLQELLTPYNNEIGVPQKKYLFVIYINEIFTLSIITRHFCIVYIQLNDFQISLVTNQQSLVSVLSQRNSR